MVKQSKGKAIPVQAWTGSEGSRRFRLQDFKTICKVVSSTHWLLLPPRKYSWYSFLLGAESSQGHSAPRKIMSIKNSIVTIGNGTHDLTAFSTVPQPTALLRAPSWYVASKIFCSPEWCLVFLIYLHSMDPYWLQQP